jgi:predicted HTH transcriptional regulator
MDEKEHTLDRFKKLTSALYRVTDLLSDKEPLKWTLRDKAIELYNNFLSDKKVNMSDIINILDLFSSEYFIANLNYDILKKEYKNLMSFMEENRKDIKPSLIEPMGPIEPVKPTGPIRPIRLIGHIGPNPNNSRKDKILELLKDNNSKTIGEIKPFFDDISEKSVQRDLIDLVKTGKLATEGEKRWRKYKILTNSQI